MTRHTIPTLRHALAWLIPVLCLPVGVRAEPPATAAQLESACIDVEVDGARALAIDCLNQALMPDKPLAPPGAPAPPSEQIAGRASNQLGLFNHAATGHRMGSAFGRSVHAPRPPIQGSASPLLPPR